MQVTNLVKEPLSVFLQRDIDVEERETFPQKEEGADPGQQQKSGQPNQLMSKQRPQENEGRNI